MHQDDPTGALFDGQPAVSSLRLKRKFGRILLPLAEGAHSQLLRSLSRPCLRTCWRGVCPDPVRRACICRLDWGAPICPSAPPLFIS